MKKFSALLVLLYVCLLPAARSSVAQTSDVRVETGTLNGASFRIEMPAKWNGVLLLYYHGYSEHPVVFEKDKPDELTTALTAKGFAVAMSGFSETGWALEQAMPETEALRRYVIAHYGKPRETYAMGHSMGGMLTAATLESYPNRYDGGLALCGLLEPTTWALERAGAMRAAFDFYYPGALPGPLRIPADFQFDQDLVDKMMKTIPANPKGEAELMALGRFKTLDDLADGVVFGSYVLRDAEQKIGASIIDNHNYIYAAGPDDNPLNDGVKRYTASDAAIDYLKTWYTPTGVLARPMLAVHTTYDPIIPPESVSVYADLVQRNGSSRNFVQQFVKADGHCHISVEETVVALDELIQWKRNGIQPKGGPVPAAAK
jgi:pimeloyl-ACP methyl ester carboxylesterase